jgi:hypothetical protein
VAAHGRFSGYDAEKVKRQTGFLVSEKVAGKNPHLLGAPVVRLPRIFRKTLSIGTQGISTCQKVLLWLLCTHLQIATVLALS